MGPAQLSDEASRLCMAVRLGRCCRDYPVSTTAAVVLKVGRSPAAGV